MPKQVIRSEKGPKPVGPYSQAVRVGDFVYVSGQGSVDPATGNFVVGDIKVQTERTLQNVKIVLEAANLSLNDVFKVTVYLKKAEDFQAMNEVYRSFFPEAQPARSTVITGLLFPEMLIEIDASAYAKKQ